MNNPKRIDLATSKIRLKVLVLGKDTQYSPRFVLSVELQISVSR